MEIKANQKNCAAMQNGDLPGQRIVFKLARFHVAHHPRNRRQVVEVSQKELVTERIVERKQCPHCGPDKEHPEVLRFKVLAFIALNQFFLSVEQQAVTYEDLHVEASFYVQDGLLD